jgi:hypothetical protein
MMKISKMPASVANEAQRAYSDIIAQTVVRVMLQRVARSV